MSEGFSGKKIVIVGASGFIGSHLCKAFQDVPCDLTMLVRKEAALSYPRGHIVSFDLDTLELACSALENADIVYYLVTQASPASNDLDEKAVIEKELAFLTLCSEMNVGSIVYASSGGAIYGEQKVLPIIETVQCQPVSAYGRLKLAAERHLEDLYKVSGQQSVSLRLANPYGPLQHFRRSQGVITHFMRCLKDNQPITVFGDGEQIKDYIYIADVIRAFLIAGLGNENISGACVLNIGSGKGASLNELMAAIEATAKARFVKELKDQRAGDIKANILDVSLAQRILDWYPQTSLSEGLEKTWDWVKEH